MFLQTKPWDFYQFNDPNIQNSTQKDKLNSKKHKDTGTANESQAKEKGRRIRIDLKMGKRYMGLIGEKIARNSYEKVSSEKIEREM